MSTPLNPKRTVAELKELRVLTADDNGAQRVAFTPMWVKTRAWPQKTEVLSAKTHVHGAFRDAAEVAAADVPTLMRLVQSQDHISHNEIEDTKEDHFELCLRAFHKHC